MNRYKKKELNAAFKVLADNRDLFPAPEPLPESRFKEILASAHIKAQEQRYNRFARAGQLRRLLVTVVSVVVLVSVLTLVVPQARAAVFSFFRRVFASAPNNSHFLVMDDRWTRESLIETSDGYSAVYSIEGYEFLLIAERVAPAALDVKGQDGDSFQVYLPLSQTPVQCYEDTDGCIAVIYPEPGSGYAKITASLNGPRELFMEALKSIRLTRGMFK